MDNVERAEHLLRDASAALEKIQTYSAIVLCQDRIEGKMRKPERIFTYFKRPDSVYLRWLPGPYEGLQASFVRSRDGAGKFQARETGLRGMVGAMTWPDDSPLIDKMYPHNFRTHETSVVFLVQLATEISNRARAMGKLTVPRLEDTTDPVLRTPATLVVTQMSSSASDGLRWPKTEFYFDAATKIPLHFILHAFDGGLYGEYTFSELKANAAVADDAFTLKKL
jgi:hypothetical protein